MFGMDELFSKRNQRDAFVHFAAKKDGCGPDGMLVSELENYWKLNGERIIQEVREGAYEPGVVECFEVLGSSGKKRVVSNLNVIDRFITRLLAQKLKRYIEPQFQRNSFAYQEGKGTVEAVMLAQHYMEENQILVEVDLKDYFDTVSLEKLMEMLSQSVMDSAVLTLMGKYLYCKVEQENRIEQKKVGLVQGMATSPILSNWYLHSLDMYMEEQGLNWIRFADNIYVFVRTQAEAEEVFNCLCRKITEEYGLQINSKKSGVYKAVERRILGYEFYQSRGQIEVRKHNYKRKESHGKWHKAVIQKVNSEYHLLQDGVLNKKDYSLLFENPDEKHHIPVEVVEQLNLYSEVTLGTGVLKTLSEKKIRCAVFDKYGMLEGYFVPAGYGKAANALLQQCTLYNDTLRRLDTAKQMELAGIHNMRANLRYYKKKKDCAVLKETITELSKCMEDVERGTDVNALLLVEARARQKYYTCFNSILKNDDFNFVKRTRQPPEDEINALISFGNTLLYNQFLHLIWRTQLNPQIGVVHASNQRSYSLNLDFADIFKPIVVDRVIFSVVNLQQIKEEDFEANPGGGIYLNKRGKIIFLQEFEEKLEDSVTIQGKKMSYRRLMEQEVQQFQKYVLTGEKYKSYKYY